MLTLGHEDKSNKSDSELETLLQNPPHTVDDHCGGLRASN
jgi:hypothetical protein